MNFLQIPMVGQRAMLGCDLAPSVQREALAIFCHRFTGEHRPASDYLRNPYYGDKPHFADDADWLANTQFAVTAAGRLDRRYKHCYSRPTWPKGKPGE